MRTQKWKRPSQPAVVTIKREVNAEKEEEARLARNNGEEMIFHLEAEGKERDSAEGAVMTLVEQPVQPRRVSYPRRQWRKDGATDSTGLPQSFSALRPTSLPKPSNIVPPRRGASPPESDAPVDADAEEEEEPAEEEEEEEEEYDSRDVEILKLVAANTPSHRGAWKKGSVEWQALVGRQSEQEDDEDYEGAPAPPPIPNGTSQFSAEYQCSMYRLISGSAGMPGSMPITIRPLVKPHANLSLASYRPSTLPPAPQGPEPEPEPEPPTPISSSSVRKQVYAERDLQRAMDPGALDFAVDDAEAIPEEDEGGGGGEEPATTVVTSSAPDDAVSSGRRRASQILQARNELPDSGLWRSLAT
ncbi:hypothetical protein FB451DRAFT_480354 [Mycena latifolia]|nr:hypothetical protein FB451DRAFT_480354 [Mycena latifolia]